jgi:hypothetical protein
MSDAIDNAEVMLSCLSLPYKESASAYRPGSHGPVMQLATQVVKWSSSQVACFVPCIALSLSSLRD